MWAGVRRAGVRWAGAVLTAAALLPATACGPSPSDPAGPISADRPLRISVAFYPLQFVTQRVAGDRAVVANLTQPGAEPHDLELTPKQVGSLTTADLVVYERGFQPAVDEAVEQSENPRVLDASTVVPLAHWPDPSHPDELADPVGTAPGAPALDETHADGGTDHEPADPHFWLDPRRLDQLADAVRARLAQIDPSHAASYANNARRLSRDLAGLDQAYRSGLHGCARREFVTTHAAFGYLADRYGLQQIPISGIDPEGEPSPTRIAAVQGLARQYGITTVFSETLVSPAVAEAIAGDLGLRTDVLDPVEGITQKSRGRDYLEVMGANLRALREANGCR